MISRRRLLQASAFGLTAGLAGEARAQSWPNRFVRVIVPYSAGGPTDLVTRVVGDRLAKIWDQQVVVENRGGAGTNIGAEAVARSNPDGYTMLVGSAALAINRTLYRTLNYDAVADFAPVSHICSFAFYMLVPMSSPAKSVKEFIAYAKEKAGNLTFASPGVGSPPHLCGELFRQMAGVEMTHVPYRGAAELYNDFLPGRVDLYFGSSVAIDQMRAGQVRGLAVSASRREALAPELPTVAESGLCGFDVTSWYGFFAPAKTPSDIVNKVSADTSGALADATARDKLQQLGYGVFGSSPSQLATLLNTDIAKWTPVIKAAGLAGNA